MPTRKERMARFQEPGLHLTIFERHAELTESLKETVRERLRKTEHILPGKDLDVTVALEAQKQDHRCSIVLHVGHFKVKVQADTTDMYSSIDEAMRRLETKVLRYKDRMQDYHQMSRKVHALEVQTIPVEDEDLALFNEELQSNQRRVVEEALHHPAVDRKTIDLKTLSLRDAVMKMDLSGDAFLVYRSEEDHTLRVIYRRKDGNYGVFALADHAL